MQVLSSELVGELQVLPNDLSYAARTCGRGRRPRGDGNARACRHERCVRQTWPECRIPSSARRSPSSSRSGGSSGLGATRTCGAGTRL